jgi:2-succinyl-5-enolpyruvyl-6-hydroxy-3-cyclohexene-1-carboxylate synthase
LFKLREDVSVNSNRGTSGIDGCVSTATGAAYANGKPTVLVVGDVSFLYDSNALWNNYLSPHLRIVIINNSGGNIFRVLDGPTKVQGFETFFETKHKLTAKHLASMYGIPYYFCAAQAELEEQLKTFFEPSKHPKILEIKTDNELSAAKYKGYFEHLRRDG